MALAGYELSSPLSLFYPSRASGQSVYRTRDTVFLFDMEDLKNLAEVKKLKNNLKFKNDINKIIK